MNVTASRTIGAAPFLPVAAGRRDRIAPCRRPPLPGASVARAAPGLVLRHPRGTALQVRAMHSPAELRSASMDAAQLTKWVHALMPWTCSPEDIGDIVVPPVGPQGPVVCLDTVFLDLAHLHASILSFFYSRPEPREAAAVRAMAKSRIAAANTWLTTSTSLTGPAEILSGDDFSRLSGGGRVARRKKALLLGIAACQTAIEHTCARSDRPRKARQDSPAERLHTWACRDQGLRARLGSAVGHPNGDGRVQEILRMTATLSGIFSTCREFMHAPEAQTHGPGIVGFLRQQMHACNDAIQPWHDLTTHEDGIVALMTAVQAQQSIEHSAHRWEYQ